MGGYNRNSRSGGGRRRGGDFRRRDSGPREMHRAVCDECGKNCEVPFRPSGDKPIYCSDCFEGKDGGSSRRPSRRGPDLSALDAKLDKILQMLEPKVEKKVVKKAAPKKAVEKEEV